MYMNKTHVQCFRGNTFSYQDKALK